LSQEAGTSFEAAQGVTQISEESNSPAVPKKTKPAGAKHKEGVFSPLVIFIKELMGDKELNELRGKVISIHSDLIATFVETSESTFGDAVLRALFRLADKNGDGAINKDELRTAVQSLGFTWLQDKQVEGLFERADADGNGSIDIAEWVTFAPKTLRTNLIKLAKKNGDEMGLLA
jgi:EF-hand domain pair